MKEGLKPATCEKVKKEIVNILTLFELKPTAFYSNRTNNPKDQFRSGVAYYKPPKDGMSEDIHFMGSTKYSVNYDSKDNYVEGCVGDRCYRVYFKEWLQISSFMMNFDDHVYA